MRSHLLIEEFQLNFDEPIGYCDSALIGTNEVGNIYGGMLNGDDVAIKIIPNEDRFADFFKNEVTMLSQFKYDDVPTIVKYRVSGKSRDSFYIFIEDLLATLRDYQKECPFEREMSQILRLAYDCAAALKYLHSKGVLHNNLNTSNVFVVKSEDRLNAKLANFSYASTIESNAKRPSHLSPVNWSAPELFRDCPYTTQTDMYSYAMLARQLVAWDGLGPYEDADNKEIIKKLQYLYDARINQGRYVLPDCPDVLFEIIQNGWRIDPTKRMPAVQVVERLLNELKKPPAPKLNLSDSMELGEGSHGKVALCLFGERKVAVKEMDWNKSSLYSVIDEIDRVRYLTRKNTPNIAAYVGCEMNVSVKKAYLIMEYCELGSLYDYIEQHQNGRDVNTCLRLSHDCTVPVDYLHSISMLHNDLKIANILLRIIEGQLTVRLADFGLARSVQYAKDHKSRHGSRIYSAPELLGSGDGYNTIQTDLYSLAMIMYETIQWDVTVIHRWVTKEEDINKIIALYVNQQNQDLPLPVDCPTALREVIENGWKIKPEKRMPASQVRATLFNALHPAVSAASVAEPSNSRRDQGYR